jgi:hypothetical protein
MPKVSNSTAASPIKRKKKQALKGGKTMSPARHKRRDDSLRRSTSTKDTAKPTTIREYLDKGDEEARDKETTEMIDKQLNSSDDEEDVTMSKGGYKRSESLAKALAHLTSIQIHDDNKKTDEEEDPNEAVEDPNEDEVRMDMDVEEPTSPKETTVGPPQEGPPVVPDPNEATQMDTNDDLSPPVSSYTVTKKKKPMKTKTKQTFVCEVGKVGKTQLAGRKDNKDNTNPEVDPE